MRSPASWDYVEGVVDGDNIYLVFTSGARIFYTGHLKPMDKNTIICVERHSSRD